MRRRKLSRLRPQERRLTLPIPRPSSSTAPPCGWAAEQQRNIRVVGRHMVSSQHQHAWDDSQPAFWEVLTCLRSLLLFLLFLQPLLVIRLAQRRPSCAMRTPIRVNGSVYPITSTLQSFSLVDNANTAWTAILASGQTQSTTISGCITLGSPTSGFALYDYVSIYDASGGYTVFPQLSNGAGSNYRIQIEANPGGVTTHGANITVTSGTTYWFTVNVNGTTGTVA